jgi:Protein of unknown function DUF262
MQIYDQDSKPLFEILKAASSEPGATLLIPDLQRPYVWSPDKVTLLVDSIIRGWPFGTLLLWEIKKDSLASIPSRAFWRIVDRTDEGFGDDRVAKDTPPAEFRMVLDGQQRLQSLLLAFGGNNWGFRLLDHEWSTALEAERPKGRNAKKHWSLGHLCLDILRFRDAIKRESEVNLIEFRDVLSWVVLNQDGGRSAFKRPKNYKNPVPSALDADNKGRFIRLSRFWTIAAERSGTVPRHYYDDVKPLLESHDVSTDIAGEVLDPLAELVVALHRIQQEKVSYLWLKPFNDKDFTQDGYNDAIVNIFTRLNTAGRALTKQEITFAWIKTGWDKSRTADRTAGQCFDALCDALADEKVSLDIDTCVGMVSAMWSVMHRAGSLLTANDLLRGDQVRPMAQDLVMQWETISVSASDGASLVNDRGFRFGVHYRSLNVLTLLLCWRLLGRQWLAEHGLNVTTKDSFEKSLDAEFAAYCDRWIILSQWSGRWGKSTDRAFADYIKDLSSDWSTIRKSTLPDEVITILKQRMDSWVTNLQVESLTFIDKLGVLTRDAVHQYYLPLWLWHRLDAARWKASELPLRESKRGSLSTDVDHVVSVKLWENLAPTENGDEDGDESTLMADDLSTTINGLGNCCLLEKSFNIAKGAEPLQIFLERVHEFKAGYLKIADWAKDIGFTPCLVNPREFTADEVRVAVEERTAQMKVDLKKYVAGELQRADR